MIFFFPLVHDQSRYDRRRRQRSRHHQKLATIIQIITADLKKGNNVVLTGFGTFRVSKRAARTGVNPRNPSQKIKIPAMKVPVFKAGKALKEAVR